MPRRVRMANAEAPQHDVNNIGNGTVRPCETYRGELVRHRVITADGMDYMVATADERHFGREFVTAAYPVSRGYLVMMRQPLCTIPSRDAETALEEHTLLVQVLAEAGTRVVRARRRSAAWRRAERCAEPVQCDPQDVAVEPRDNILNITPILSGVERQASRA